MFTLTGGKARTGRALGNPGGLDDRFGDLPLALRLLAGLLANAAFGTWWADPLAGLVIVDYALAEARAIFTTGPEPPSVSTPGGRGRPLEPVAAHLLAQLVAVGDHHGPAHRSQHPGDPRLPHDPPGTAANPSHPEAGHANMGDDAQIQQ